MRSPVAWSWWRMWFAALGVLTLTAQANAQDRATEAELSDDFLEYLGSVEDEQENWTDLAANDRSAKSASSSSASESSKRNEQISEPDTQRNVALPAAKAVK